MSDESQQPDPAAVFGCALSLWQACWRPSKAGERVNLSECYNGGDEFMRVVMRVGTRFETWASLHIAFDELDDVWPYMMEDRFGAGCVEVMGIMNLADFDDSDCLRVALQLRLPVRLDTNLPVPVDVSAASTVPNSPFSAFRIQTVRELCEDNIIEPFTLIDDPFDEQFGPPYFALYGVESDGLLEHIADRRTYADAAQLARSLSPGIAFPDSPHITPATAFDC
jgi:hypothetical protein